LGQPTQAGTFATGVQYYPNGAVQQFVYGNGIVHQMQQNARLLPARSTDTGTLDLLTSFDVNGNVSAINDLVQGSGHDRQMQYDALDRLTAAYSPAFGGDGWYRFGYDALDNLRTWTQPGEGQRRYDYDSSNRLTLVRNAAGAGIIGLGYDVQGNLSIKNGQAYQFDFGNRLRQATNLERYRYDGHGRRSSVIDAGSGKNRHYLYSQGGALAYLWDQGTGETTQYIQLAGSLVATRKLDAGGAASVRYQHTDALGSPVAETNEQAGVVQRTAYTPYGASIGAQKDGVGYTGHVMDGSTGLTYMQQRYMDPTVGGFLSVDPVTAHSSPVGAFNRYRYANNSPYRFSDPDGRQAISMPAPYLFPVVVTGARDSTQRSEASDGDNRGSGPDGGRPTTRPTGRPTGRDSVRRGRDGAPIASSNGRSGPGDLHAPGDVPDGTVIVRGGQSDMPSPGTTFSGSQGNTVSEAGAAVPHGSIRPTTAGNIRAGGGTVEVSPEKTSGGNVNGNHVNITEGKKGSSFGPVQPNPVPKADRIK